MNNKNSFYKEIKETPLMKQYNCIKSKYSDSILLFQVGDFYETFGKDAVLCSEILNIVLTKRSNNIYLSGFPCHSLNTYLSKLVRSGFRIAICNQLEEPRKDNKSIVKRGVVELITPGTIIDENILKKKLNNYLSSIYIENDFFGLSLLDFSTGEFLVIEDKKKNIFQYLNYFYPKEILIKEKDKIFVEKLFKTHYYLVNNWFFNYQFSYEILISHFGTNSLKGFGINKFKLGIISSGVIINYLHENKNNNINHISKIQKIEKKNFVWIDDYTFRNLEIFHPINNDGKSLIDVIDCTITPMGGRMLKNWILFPSKNISVINERLESVQELYNNNIIRFFVKKNLKNIRDIERIISKMVVGKITPREIFSFGKSIFHIEKIRKEFLLKGKKNIKKIGKSLYNCYHIYNKIISTIKQNEVDFQIEKGKNNVILKGVSKDLDRMRNFYFCQKEHIKNLCLKEQSKTGISNIKINYNNLFGYLFEIRKKNKKKVPKYWIHKQTLSNIERFTTEELKDYELKILNVEQKIIFLEKKIFQSLIDYILIYIKKLQKNAKIIAIIDVLYSFSKSALENNYKKPKLNKSFSIVIKNGRHPVIEKQFIDKNHYIPNNIFLDKKKQQILLITGPNMSGKSAILRQTAIIVLLSHIGSFVPSDKAEIGIIDKIFSRIGSSDNISVGESTFMVEMNETANILNNMTTRSLIILDEIGRGTGTYDGISIAKSIIEFLHDNLFRPYVLFATHYHEISELFFCYDRVKNYYISAKIINNNIIFTRKLTPGYARKSFGIHVAKMAGIPIPIINRAKKIFKEINTNRIVIYKKKD